VCVCVCVCVCGSVCSVYFCTLYCSESVCVCSVFVEGVVYVCVL
jgi:hypothetical protein